MKKLTTTLILTLLMTFTVLGESYVAYGSDGKLTATGNTSPNINKDGWYKGEWKNFNKDGSIKSEGDYLYKDEIYKFYAPEGWLRREGRGVNGLAEGEWIEYFPTGNIRAKGTRRKEARYGLWTFYYEDGTIFALHDYVLGKRQGVLKSFHRNGNLCSENTYWKGEMEGVARRYYDDGKIEWEQSYVNGKRHGKGARVDRDGSYLWVTEYENGKLLPKKTKFLNEELGNQIEYFNPNCSRGLKAINRPILRYPQNLWRDAKEGCVIVNYTINEQGSTENVNPTWSSRKGFKNAAKSYVSKLKYKPPVGANGELMSINFNKLVVFAMPVNGKMRTGYVPSGCDLYEK